VLASGVREQTPKLGPVDDRCLVVGVPAGELVDQVVGAGAQRNDGGAVITLIT
jgi:hypothetical protein